MKLLLFITTILLTISGVNGQNKIAQDSILNNLEQEITTDWDIAISEDTIMIISKIDMYIDFYNIAGAPFNDPEYTKYTPQYLIENGKKTNSTILLIMEPKWTQAKLTRVQNENSMIYNEIEALIYKHKLSHLERTFRWHEELFGNTTEAEKERIILYRAEKESLMNKITDIPIYESENYSIYILSRNWRFTETNSSHLLPILFPETENKKIAILEETIDQLLKNNYYPSNISNTKISQIIEPRYYNLKPEQILDEIIMPDVVNYFNKDFDISYPYLFSYGVDSENKGVLVSKDSIPLLFLWNKYNSDSLYQIQVLNKSIKIEPKVSVGMTIEDFLLIYPNATLKLDMMMGKFEYFYSSEKHDYIFAIESTPKSRIGIYAKDAYETQIIADKKRKIDRIMITKLRK